MPDPAYTKSDNDRDIRILVDAHGGDSAPDMVLDALEAVLSSAFTARFSSPLTFGVVGQEELLRPLLRKRGIEEQVSLVPSTDVVEMCDSPSHALRRKKDSSIHVGARMVRDGYWDDKQMQESDFRLIFKN